jgi:splicing factor U2AF subunit
MDQYGGRGGYRHDDRKQQYDDRQRDFEFEQPHYREERRERQTERRSSGGRERRSRDDRRREERREEPRPSRRDREEFPPSRGRMERVDPFPDEREERGRPVARREASRTPSRTPSYSPIFKDRPSQWDQTIAAKGGSSGNVNQPNPQQLSQRRLYVGNVPDSVDEEELVNFFNNAMIRANVITKPGEPVIAASIYRDKGYAFIELRSAEEATSGLEFNGINIHGHPLKVNRPNDYKEPLKGSYNSAASQANINLVSSNVADTDYKIFVGGLPPNISEDKIKKLLSYFGDLRSFNLVRDPGTSLSKGFAFCEYVDHDVTDYACMELNGMTIGDKTLVVQRASTNPKNQPQYNVTPTVQPLVPSAASMLNLSRPAATLLAAAVKNATEGVSRILVLLNIVNMVEFPGDEYEEDYDRFVDDVFQEAMKYGNVKTIVVPRNPFKRKTLSPLELKQSDHTIERYPFDIDDSSDEEKDEAAHAFQRSIETALNEEGEEVNLPNVDGFGKVYIEYANTEEAKYAMRALSGRRYNGRMVITSYLEEDKWKDRVLEPPLKHEILTMAADLDKEDQN